MDDGGMKRTDLTKTDRVRLTRKVERFPHFEVPEGATGTVVFNEDGLLICKMDVLILGCEEWDNEVIWSDNDGDAWNNPPLALEEED